MIAGGMYKISPGGKTALNAPVYFQMKSAIKQPIVKMMNANT